jgi:hypothetical protein
MFGSGPVRSGAIRCGPVRVPAWFKLWKIKLICNISDIVVLSVFANRDSVHPSPPTQCHVAVLPDRRYISVRPVLAVTALINGSVCAKQLAATKCLRKVPLGSETDVVSWAVKQCIAARVEKLFRPDSEQNYHQFDFLRTFPVPDST